MQAETTPTPLDLRVAELGVGGMGRVDLVVRRSGTFTRLLAVKRIKPDMLEDGEARRMLIDEARLAGLVRHPNVVSVTEVGEDESGPYLVMDFIEGVAASKLIRQASLRGERLPIQICARIVADVATGLHAAHEARSSTGEPLEIVHRDVSPHNVLVGYDGIARLTDFGIARALGRSTRTRTGVLKGKLAYLSPEQLRFEEPTRRSDVFALGIVLYELLACTRLYEDSNAGARRILSEPPRDVRLVRPDVPTELAELVLAALAKDPAARPATAMDVARVLEREIARVVVSEGTRDVGELVAEWFAGERVDWQARIREVETGSAVRERVVIEPPVTRPGRRRAWVWVALGAVALVGVAALVVGAWERPAIEASTDPEPEPESAPEPEPESAPEPEPAPEPATAEAATAEAAPPEETSMKQRRARRRAAMTRQDNLQNMTESANMDGPWWFDDGL